MPPPSATPPLPLPPEEQANSAALKATTPTTEPRRHLSWWRLAVVVAIVLGAAATVVAVRPSSDSAGAATPVSFFSPYVDVTITPQFAFEDPTQVTAAGIVLGFVVSPSVQSGGTTAAAAAGTVCQPSWGGAYSLDAATSGLDLDRRIARVQQRGGGVSASFGGAANDELAIGCSSTPDLSAAYTSVITRYSLSAIDFDIETPAASADDVNARRAAAVKDVQDARSKDGHPLSVWLTLPVSTSGLTEHGLAVVKSMLAAHVDIAGINALTMDFPDTGATPTMTQRTTDALTSVERQVLDSYRVAGRIVTDDQAWQLIGATPMIGQNDVADQRFELTDAQNLLNFARLHHLARLSMWSANRDQSCGVNYANPEVVSGLCSGVNQQPGAYSAIFDTFTPPAAGAGRPSASLPSAKSSAPGTGGAGAQSTGAAMLDNPATSPYPIWSAAGAYPKNTKIVWHHNVYEAKWWTEGDVPDAPVSDPTSTPWVLIGPVLPGEHPAPLPTLSEGTYPDWNAANIYVAGQRVLFNGVPYQAKWWTQDQPPVATPLHPADTPWQLLGASG
jgi:chitinase